MAQQSEDPEANFNIVCAVVGAFIGLFGLVSYLLKESLFVSEPLIALAAGAALSPFGLGLIHPDKITSDTIETSTLCFTRLVLGIQVAIAGVRLPSKYPRREWRSLAILLGPGMLGMWAATSLLVWLVVPDMQLVGALVIGACMTPTDPVLSNSVVQGSFAERHMPEPLRMIIIGESGANDGLGYLFLYLPLYLYQHARDGSEGAHIGNAVLSFLGMTLGREVLLGVVYGAAVGWAAKYVLYWSEKKNYIDEESFHFFVIALALFIIGSAGLLDINDVLACFVAGVMFTWDDWFTEQTKEDNLQPIMDFLLSVSIFMWLGAACPWDKLFNTTPGDAPAIVPWPRLVLLAVLVLIFRRLPVILALHRLIPQVRSVKHASIMGFFGPIGISAIFYLYTTRQFLRDEVGGGGGPDDGREDTVALADQTLVVMWFMVFSSVVVHGLAIPVGSLGSFVVRYLRASLGQGNKSGNDASGRQEEQGHAENGEQRPLLG
ncbi:Cation/H+ exchanger [Microdochium bolleyi]|uniref:Cation/H+ exchanger n=1 Tax=Microdochium bolleyi TaxID=196109 RepID=A0A136IKG3_9PEZI|nr:Cation/H+ exchanger [Microdochium bolleyi]